MADMTPQQNQKLPGPMPRWGTRGTSGVSFAANLEFNDVHVKFQNTTALEGLSLSVNPGEIICLLGPSGCGKSTLLRAAAGIQQINAGSINISGEMVSNDGHCLPPEQRGVGLVFQDFALFPHLTVLKNVMFGLDFLKKSEAKTRAQNLLERVGLRDRANDYPHMLSGGQQQRVALARAIAPRPGILLMDEPFSGLDARLRETMRTETLAVLRETGSTSLIVTHDPEEAMMLGDRIALMHEGKIVQIGPSRDIFDRPNSLFTAQYFSTLSTFQSVVKNRAADTPFGPISVEGFADGTAIDIALRPTALTLTRKKPDENGVPARISTVVFAGLADHLEILVAGIDKPLQARIHTTGEFIAGEDVFVSLCLKDVLVFPSD